MNRAARTGAGAALALGLGAAAIMAACAGEETAARQPDPKAQLRFRLDRMAADLEFGRFDDAFASSARLRRERRSDADLVAAMETVMQLAAEGGRYPDPARWDYAALEAAWQKLAESPAVPRRMKELAGRRAVFVARERAAAAALAAMARESSPLQAMRARAELLAKHGPAMVVRREPDRIEGVRARFDSALRDDVRRHLAETEPDWEGIAQSLDEGAKMLGGSDPELRRMRDECAAGLQDLRVLLGVLDLFDRGEWSRASEELGRIRPGSRYAKAADEARRNIGYQQRLDQAVRAYRAGEARATAQFTELAAQWPSELTKNRDIVELLARETPRVVAGFKEGEERRLAGDPRAAVIAYRGLLDTPVTDGFYRREAQKRLEECLAEIRRALDAHAAGFAPALDAKDYAKALEHFRGLAALDDGGSLVAAARKRVAPCAAAMCAEIERRCWSGRFGESDRAAAALLEAVLRRPDVTLSHLDELKKTYSRNFSDGRKP